MKRIIALVLSLVMALSLCAPVWGMLPTSNINMGDSVEITEEDGGDVPATPTSVPVANVKEITDEYPDVKATVNNWGGNAEEISAKLNFALQFQPTEEAEDIEGTPYEYWHADYVVTVDKDVPGNSMALCGYYQIFCDTINDGKWVALTSPHTVEANTEIRLVQLLGDGGITVSYQDICTFGNDDIGFLCGVSDLTGQNTGTTITVELRLYETKDPSETVENTKNNETGHYEVVGTYSYTFGPAADVDGVRYNDLQAAVDAAASTNNKTVTMLKNVTVTEPLVVDGVTLDGAGYTLTSTVSPKSLDDSIRGDGNAKMSAIFSNEGCTIKDLTIVGGWKGVCIDRTATVDTLLDNVTILNSARGINFNDVESEAKLTVKDSTLSGWSGVEGNGVITFENTTFKKNDSTRGSGLDPYGAITLTNCTFDAGTVLTAEDIPAGKAIAISNGIYNGELKVVDGKGTFSITGGTFADDPSDYVADGYKAVECNGVYTVMKTYNVTFDANGGSGTLTIAPMVESEFILPANPFTAPAGKQFKGWATSKDATEVLGETYKVTGDVTFYAVWEDAIVPVPVPDKDNNETSVEVEAVVSGTTATINKVEKLEEITSSDAKAESVTLDFSEVKGAVENTDGEVVETPVSTVVIPAASVEKIVEVVASTDNNVNNLEIVTADATVTFDTEATKAIGTNAGNAAITFTVDVETVSTATDITDVNKEAFDKVMEKAAEGKAVLLSIDLTGATENDKLFSENKAAGTASVKVKLADGLKSATLYYLDGDEAKYLGSYNADAAGYITVTLKHFSEYVLLGSTNTVYTSGYYPVVGGTSTTTKPVVSADTFDAGIGMYVAMSVMAAAGSAIVIGKKKEF